MRETDIQSRTNAPDANRDGSTTLLARRVIVAFGALVALMAAAFASTPPSAPVPVLPSDSISAPPMFGAFTYGGVWKGMQPVHQLEDLLGRRLDIVHWFMSWDTPYDVKLVETASAGGRIPMITWQPHKQSISAIASGRYDGIIKAFADGVRVTPGLVYVRPFPEMNGDWEPWNGQPATFVKAWRHMVDIFRSEGASNVRWVWSPNVTDQPRTAGNAMERYYPGSSYVDVLALDGYNWGTTQRWSSWESFNTIFAHPYARVAALGPQPIWVAEVASTSVGGDKAAWVASMLASTKFPRIKALVWFNQNNDMDWRLDNSLAVVQALRSHLTPGVDATASR